jgi:spermidine synthase
LVWIRLLSLVLGSSTYSFSLMLTTFIAGIALGGLAARLLLRRDVDALMLFGLCQLGVFVALICMIPLYERLPYLFNVLATGIRRTESTYAVYLLVKAFICFLAMLPPTVLIGLTLPLVAHVTASRVEALGRSVGAAFAVNTLGNVVGSIGAGFLIIPLLGVQNSLEAGMVASGLIGGAAMFAAMPSRRPALRIAPVLGVLAVFVCFRALAADWDTFVMNFGLYRLRVRVAPTFAEFRASARRQVVLYHRDGREASVAVGHSAKTPDRIWLNINGKTDASTGSDLGTQLLLGHLPVLFADSVQDALIVGLGSGVTAGAVLRHPVRRCDIVEISPAVVEASRFFDRFSGAPLDDPRTRLCVADAKEFLQLKPDNSYDAIISEPSNPWIAGIGTLFSLEFYREVSKKLRDGGLLVQWVQMYETNDTILSVVMNTLSAVFPHVTVWHSQGNDLILLAAKQPLEANAATLRDRLARPGVLEQLGHRFVHRKVSNLLTLLSLQVMSSARFRERYPGDGPLNRDRHPYLEYRTPEAFFLGSGTSFLDNDERLKAVTETRLFLGPYLVRVGLSEADMRTLIDFFAVPIYPSEKRILRGLVHNYATTYGLESTDLPLDVKRRIATLHVSLGNVAMTARHGEWMEKLTAGSMTERDWREYFDFAMETLRATNSIYFFPNLSRVQRAYAECTGLFPLEAPRFGRQLAQLYADLGLPPPPSTP